MVWPVDTALHFYKGTIFCMVTVRLVQLSTCIKALFLYGQAGTALTPSKVAKSRTPKATKKSHTFKCTLFIDGSEATKKSHNLEQERMVKNKEQYVLTKKEK